MALPQPVILQHPARDWTNRDGQPILAIVIHATAGTNSLSWLSGNDRRTSIHVLIEKDGTCYQMVSDERGANHVGYSQMTLNGMTYGRGHAHNCNQVTLGIELENLNNGKDPYPMKQLQVAAWWIQYWQDKFGGQLRLFMHRDIDTQSKSDAKGLQMSDITSLLDTPAPPPVSPPGQVVSMLAVNAPLLAAPRTTVDRAVRYITKRGTHTSYTPNDVQTICAAYWNVGRATGIDPLIAVAQMILETDNLKSWWSLRPRRNPAGLGVTGESGSFTAKPGVDWAYQIDKKLWRRGASFASWDISVRAHIGHLLVYAVAPTLYTQQQKQAILFDPRATAVPQAKRGSVPLLSGLAGTWAVPGTGYAESIADIATRIMGT